MKEIEMSTRCSILVEVPDDLIGQTLKYQKQDNELNWDKDIDKTEPVKITKKYLGIYCHHDGYPNGVGSELVNRYNNLFGNDVLFNFSGSPQCFLNEELYK